MNYLPTHPLILPTPCSYPRARFHPQRALMPPNDLRTMQGEVFAVLPAEHPIRADQRPYYEDPRLRRHVPDPEKTDVLAGLRRQYPLPDPGLGVELPDREEVQDAIETQQTEGTYVKSGSAPSKHTPASENGNRYSERNSAMRFCPADAFFNGLAPSVQRLEPYPAPPHSQPQRQAEREGHRRVVRRANRPYGEHGEEFDPCVATRLR